MTTNHCGTCTACCRVFAIPDFDKPAGKWCDHCAIGKGCKIYADRPQRCVDFKCLWLLSREQEPQHHLDDALRPDRCKVVFSPTTNESIMAATVMPGAMGAENRPVVRELIDRILKGGMAVAVGMPAGRTQRVLYPTGKEKTVTMTAPDADGMQWRIMKDGED